MRFAFLLPAYKTDFLEQALRSILAQTYQEFDVLVSDDCSPQDIKSIVDRLADSRVRYRRNDHNFGVKHLAEHWNLLLGLTSAEYILLASDDDVYHKDFLKEMDALIEKYPDCDVFRPRIDHIDENGVVLSEEEPFGTDMLDRKQYLQMLATHRIWSGVPQYVFKLKALRDAGGFADFPAAWYSDDATVCKLSAHGLGIVDKVLFSFRESRVSITSGTQSDDMIRDKIIASSKYASFLKEELKDPEYQDVIRSLYGRARYVTYQLVYSLPFLRRIKQFRNIAAQHSDLFDLRTRLYYFKFFRLGKIKSFVKKYISPLMRKL